MDLPEGNFQKEPASAPPAEAVTGQNGAANAAAPQPLWGVPALEAKREAIRRQQARFASRRERWIEANKYYYDIIKRLLRFIIEPQRRVLNVRCQTGFLLDAVNPSRGVGVEVSREMVEIARQKFPRHEFRVANPEELQFAERFDYILFDQVNDTVDVLRSFQHLKPLCEPHSRMVIYTYNHLWEPLAWLGERLGLKMPFLEPNWLSEGDLKNLLELAGFEWLRTYRVVLCPKWIPLVSWFLNRIVARLPGLARLCMVNMLVARPAPAPRDPRHLRVSVVVPCKNERGNIEPAVRRIPDMGCHTEIIFCDDKSTDGTAEEVRRLQQAFPHRDIKLVNGPGIAKGQNVWTGFRAADGEVLMILDADLTVMPEELPYFLEALAEGRGDFINGSRMVYPMQATAMKTANMIGNKLFSLLFTCVLSQPVRDTLCGTKVLWRSDWKRIEPLIGCWGITDRWGDYELLFGATKLHLRIMDLPVHYQERVHGATKMVRVFRNGLRMLGFCFCGYKKLKAYY